MKITFWRYAVVAVAGLVMGVTPGAAQFAPPDGATPSELADTYSGYALCGERSNGWGWGVVVSLRLRENRLLADYYQIGGQSEASLLYIIDSAGDLIRLEATDDRFASFDMRLEGGTLVSVGSDKGCTLHLWPVPLS